MDPELVDFVYAQFAPHADALAQSGLFAPPVDVPEDADPQTRLLAPVRPPSLIPNTSLHRYLAT